MTGSILSAVRFLHLTFTVAAAISAASEPTRKPCSTGVQRRYDFTISRTEYAPDGVRKTGLLVNGQFPGPTIEADYGDEFVITVKNNITGPEEGTAIHWHGLLHKGSPWYDGVPAVDHCPIAPGHSFTYTFRADQAGSSWWHSHYDAQFADGIVGLMIIRGSPQVPYDIELPPMSLSSHYWKPYHEIIEQVTEVPAITAFSDNTLINGMMYANCSAVNPGQQCSPNAPLYRLPLTPNKTHLLRIINTSPQGTMHFSIDGHQLKVVANDYVEVKPYSVDHIVVSAGQRTDVLIQGLDDCSSASSFWIRSDMNTTCDPTHQPSARGIAYYPDVEQASRPDSQPWTYGLNCANDALSQTIPVIARKPPSSPATVQELTIGITMNQTGHRLFTFNNQPFYGDYNQPISLLVAAGNTSFPNDPQWNVYNYGSNASVRFVIYNRTPLWHPMHLHGHNFWVLAEGVGTWNGSVVNPENPQRRDTQILPGGSVSVPAFIVVEIETDNPGVWPLHCHILWHVATGLYMNVIERPDELIQYKVPGNVVQTCRDWWSWTNHHVVDQIDSGL